MKKEYNIYTIFVAWRYTLKKHTKKLVKLYQKLLNVKVNAENLAKLNVNAENLAKLNVEVAKAVDANAAVK